MADGLSEDQVGQTLDYLGQAQPLARGRLTLPSESAAGGGSVQAPVTGGGGTSPGAPSPMGREVGTSGFSPLAGAKSALELAKRISGVFDSENAPTRGQTGGTSLSDFVRSVQGGAVSAIGGNVTTANAPFDVTKTFQTGDLTATQQAGQELLKRGFTAEQLLQMSPAEIEAAAAGGAGGAVSPALEGGGAALGAADVLAGAGGALSIAQEAMGNKPDVQKGLDSAIDAAATTAAIALAGTGFGIPIAAAALAAKQDITNSFRLFGGNEPSRERQIMDIVEKLPTGIGITGLALDTLLGLFGTDVTSIFGGKGSFVPKRQAAAGEATADLASLGSTLQSGAEQFAQTGDPGAALTALQTQYGARNPVRADINVPMDVAKQLGIGEDIVGTARDWGDHLQLTWQDFKTPQQFQSLLGYLSTLPDQGASMLLGSGDVGYLPGAQAGQVAGSAVSETQQFLAFLISQMGSRGGPGGGSPSGPPGVTPAGPEGALGFTGPQNALGFAQAVTA